MRPPDIRSTPPFVQRVFDTLLGLLMVASMFVALALICAAINWMR